MADEIMPGVVRLRDQHEALTRQTILRTARELFAARGYAGTPIRLLAQHAGVSPQTIYATFGSKAGVVAALPDLIDQDAGAYELYERRQATRDPLELIGLYAAVNRRIRELYGDLLRIVRAGMAGDADLAATEAEGFRRHRLSAQDLVIRLEKEGALKPGLAPERATAIAASLAWNENGETLVDRFGWSYDDYETWLKETLATLLLADEPEDRAADGQ
jgi:AcrR family transcriptional regulator